VSLASGVGTGCENVAVPTSGGGWYPRSFVLTDIVDSVSLWERDPESMSKAVARHDVIVGREVVAACGALVRSKGEGDSTFSVFAHPTAAVNAAVAIQEAVAAERWPTCVALRVRAGVHTGDAEPRDGDWYGPAVNRAARLRALAGGGQTLVSGVTAGLVADQIPASVRLLYRGRRVLRGIERPEEVWELVAADDARLATPAQVGCLPVALTQLVGRTADVDCLVRLIEEERLVTLTGPGGSGKTRLAIEVAKDAMRRGTLVWLAELASVRDGGLVPQVVAATVGGDDGPDRFDQLLAAPQALAGVLVLDNCEHLLDACAALARRLLAAAPELRLLATSREPLGLAGEREWPVTPLDVPDESVRDRDQLARVASVELLVNRARLVRPDFEVSDDEIGSVVHICRALDGMPLAIELAAGRLRSLTLAGLAARLDDQLALLAHRGSTGADDVRHQTLRMTMDWSYDLLDDQQRTLARRLSVFAGGFRLDAVEAVCAAQVDVLDGVDELVAKSLVTFDAENARYRLLEPLRQYLAERLDQADEVEVLRRAHAEWVADLADRLGTGFVEAQATRSRRLREETSNIDLAIRWALDHGDRETALRIVGSLGHYCFYYDQASGRGWCDLVTAIDTDAPSLSWAKALVSAGMVAQNDQAWDRSVTLLREALRIYRLEDAPDGQAASLLWLGRALANRTDADHSEDHASEARQCFENSVSLYTRLGDRVGAAWGRILLSAQAYWNHDLDRSEQLANEVVRDCHAAGVRHPMGAALGHLAFIARRRGHNDTALELLQHAVALSRDLNVAWQVAGLLVDLAAHQATMAQGDQALQALAESTQLDAQIGRLPGRSVRLAVAALVHRARGQPALSIAALGAYDAHPVGTTGWGRPVGAAGSIGWLADAIEATRAQLDPAEIAAATAAARSKTLDELMDELIIQPAIGAL
jgi:predicted ATPase/class 3 adenylate cyclase